eukprot:1131099-Pyramimonas_sp.AAC.1
MLTKFQWGASEIERAVRIDPRTLRAPRHLMASPSAAGDSDTVGIVCGSLRGMLARARAPAGSRQRAAKRAGCPRAR